MNTADYINTINKERIEFKELCKKHAETIHTLKREITKLNNANLKQNKKIQKLENESINIKMKTELENVKSEFENMKIKYEDLQNKYDVVVAENIEMKRIFDDVETTFDGD